MAIYGHITEFCKLSAAQPITDLIAADILPFEGESRVEWFEGNFQDYEKDKMRRLEQDSIFPHRVKYEKLTR